MSKKPESSLQERIQRLIEMRGGYVNKNWGSMISEPGIADLTVCYKGFYLTIEVKIHDNKPSAAQGIHARKVRRAGGITVVVWSMGEVELLLDEIDKCIVDWIDLPEVTKDIDKSLTRKLIDNGTEY